MRGLFLGYLYFSIPRVIVTVMASADRSSMPAARGSGALARRLAAGAIMRDVVSAGARAATRSRRARFCFATAMGAFGTAFTLATDIDVLPMTIYTEFTLTTRTFAAAAALSIVLGIVTWAVLVRSQRDGSPSARA